MGFQNETTILLTGEAVKRARRALDLKQELVDRKQAIEERANAELKIVQEELVAEIEAEFNAILTQYKIPVEDGGIWHLQARYLRTHDIAFLELDENEAVAAAFIRSRLMGDTKH